MKVFLEIQTWIKSFRLLSAAIKNDLIYIIRKDAVGDVLWTEPVIRALAASNKNYVFVTQYPELFENFPYKNVTFKNTSDKKYKRTVKLLKKFGFTNHLIDLKYAYEKNTQQHFLHSYQQVAKLPFTNEYPKLYLTGREKQLFKNLKPYVVLHLESYSMWNYRRVFGIDWQIIINYLNELGFKPYIISKEPTSFENAYHVKTTLREMISLIYNASFFIGIDSGPSHIAASLKVPAIIFFGAVNPWFRHFPETFKGIIMQQECEYGNCYHRVKENISGLPCLITGGDGIPKCSIHSNTSLIKNIETIVAENYTTAL